MTTLASAPARVRDRAGNLVTVLVGGALALTVLIVEVAYRSRPHPADPLNYFDFARHFPYPQAPIPTGQGQHLHEFAHQYLRTGLILPMRLAQEIFGYSEAAYYAVPMLAGVGLTVAVYVLGVLLFSRSVGVAAGLLGVGNSIVFPEITQPLPDLLATTLMCWAVVLAVAVRQHRGLVTSTRRRETATLLAVGALLGWSYLARETIVFLWPLIPVLLFGRVRIRRMLWIVLPIAVVGVAETAYTAIVFGDPLARLVADGSHGGTDAEDRFGYFGHSRRWYATMLIQIFGTTPEVGWLKGALVAAVLGAFFSRKLAFLLLWFGLYYVPITVLGGLLNPDGPMLRLTVERYWSPLLPALALGAAAACWLLLREGVRRIRPLVQQARLVAGVVTLTVVAIPLADAFVDRSTNLADTKNLTYAVNGGNQLESVPTWLARNGSEVRTIWSDPSSAALLELFVKGPFGQTVWNGHLENWIPGANQPGPRPGDHVFFYSRMSRLCTPCARAATAVLGGARIPPSWRLVFASDDRVVELYEVR